MPDALIGREDLPDSALARLEGVPAADVLLERERHRHLDVDPLPLAGPAARGARHRLLDPAGPKEPLAEIVVRRPVSGVLGDEGLEALDRLSAFWRLALPPARVPVT